MGEAAEEVLVEFPDAGAGGPVAVGVGGVAAEDGGRDEAAREVAGTRIVDTAGGDLVFAEFAHAAAVEVEFFREGAAVDLEGERVVVVGRFAGELVFPEGELPAEAVAHGEFVGAADRAGGVILQEGEQAAARIAGLHVGIDGVDGEGRADAGEVFAVVVAGFAAEGVAHAGLGHEVALVGAVDEHARAHGDGAGLFRLRDGATEAVGRSVIEREGRDRGAGFGDGGDAVLVEDFDAVRLREVGEQAAVLRIGETVFEDFFRGAAGGFGAAPVDVDEAAAGHAAEPAAGLDHEDAAALAGGGDGGGDTGGVAGVDADVGGAGAGGGGAEGGRERDGGGGGAEVGEKGAAVEGRGHGEKGEMGWAWDGA